MIEYNEFNTANEFDNDIVDAEFDLPWDYASIERADSDKIVDWWEEDYSFDALLEEFDLTTKDAFYALLQTGVISPDDVTNYLISE